MGLRKNKVVDPLTQAENALGDALAVFEDAKNNLSTAVEQYGVVQQQEQARIERAQKRQAEAQAQQAKAERVHTALTNLLGAE